MKHDISYDKCHAIKTIFDVGPSNISHIKVAGRGGGGRDFMLYS